MLNLSPKPYLAVMVGNSRLHWAVLGLESADRPPISPSPDRSPSPPPLTCDSPPLPEALAIDRWLPYLQALPFPPLAQSWLRSQLQPPLLRLASVNPPQAALFATYPQLNPLQLQDIPLGQQYAGLGIDRALALWGAGQGYGWPVLVIDGGTALTVTGGDRGRNLVGGAILPGLRLQWLSLSQGTGQLPWVQWSIEEGLPDRWARSPEGAIASGVLHSVMAGLRSFIEDWQQQFGTSAIVITGGDGELLFQLLKQQFPTASWHNHLYFNPSLTFIGLTSL